MALSVYIWQLKDQNVLYDINWEIEERAQTYKPGGQKCNLCIAEKAKILMGDNKMLNTRSELVGKFRHRRKHKLGNIGGNEETGNKNNDLSNLTEEESGYRSSVST